jgi:signal transduction histidine kinase
MLQRSRQYADLQADLQKKLETAQSAQGEAQPAQAQSDASLLEIQEETQTLLVHLKEENQQLKEALTKSSPEAGSRILAFDKLEKELRSSLAEVKSRSQEKSQEMQQLKEEHGLALSELDHLRTQLTQTEQQVNEVKAQSTQQLTSEQIAEIASTVKELRHPISTIIDYVDLLLDESVGALGALQHKFLDRIKVSVDQLGELINQLVQSTLLDSTKIRITSRVIDLNAIIEAALAATRPQIQEKNINLHVDVPKTYPTIRADGDALQQVLTNILRNAEVSTSADGIISLQVRIEEKDDQKHLLFQVTDSGEGISSEDLPQVFSRPYRADNAPIRGIDGPGMELSITKTLVEALKGHIWVDSQVGHGSTFSFLIPLIAEVEPSESSTSPNIKSSGVVKK